MKFFLKLLPLSIFLILLNTCAKPTVVNVVLPGDDKLNCKHLKNAVAETEKIKQEAEYAKDGTGGNITRIMLFWPAWAQTIHNADVAITAANDRNYHLINLMKKKECEGVDKINSEITNTSYSKDNVVRQLKDLKDLYDSGDLTKQEYKQAKKKILSQ